MKYTTHSPAIVAGLLGAATTSLARPAYAMGRSAAALTLPTMYASADFLMGMATGAVACGIVSFVIFVISEQLDRRAEQRQAEQRTSKESVSADASFASLAGDTCAGMPVVLDVVSEAVQDKTDEQAEVSATLAPNGSADSLGAHVATDYADIAENYVEKLSWKQRMASRAAGVKAMLTQRLGQDMLQDVPVITRADGSVGDVGTGWWDAAMAANLRRDKFVLAAEKDFDATLAHRHVSPATSEVPQPAKPHVNPTVVSNTQSVLRADQIRCRIPEVDLGIYPEHRNFACVDNTEDLWNQAMTAMEARDTEPATAAGTPSDELDPSTLHAPDTPTAVLPFRPVAGHPEVVDKSSYVDYLLRQEIENNSSDVVKRSSRDYLRVLEGGSMSSAPTLFNIARTEHAKSNYVPKHMAGVAKDAENEAVKSQEESVYRFANEA